MADTPLMSGERPVISVSPTLQSNINWTQVIALVVGIASIFGYVIPEHYQLVALQTLAIATPILTLWFRNFNKGNVPTVPEIKVLAEDKGLVIAPFKVETVKAVTPLAALPKAKAKPKK